MELWATVGFGRREVMLVIVGLVFLFWIFVCVVVLERQFVVCLIVCFGVVFVEWMFVVSVVWWLFVEWVFDVVWGVFVEGMCVCVL